MQWLTHRDPIKIWHACIAITQRRDGTRCHLYLTGLVLGIFCSRLNQEFFFSVSLCGLCVVPLAIRLAVHHSPEVCFSICRWFWLTSRRHGFVGPPHRHVWSQGVGSLVLHSSLATFNKPYSQVLAQFCFPYSDQTIFSPRLPSTNSKGAVLTERNQSGAAIQKQLGACPLGFILFVPGHFLLPTELTLSQVGG